MKFDDHNIDNESFKATIIGKTAMIFTVCMYAAPAQNLATVLKTQNYDLIPLHISIIGFLCSFTSLLYGLLNFDVNIVVPNVLGVSFTVFQIIVWIYFWKKAKQNSSYKEIKEETKE